MSRFIALLALTLLLDGCADVAGPASYVRWVTVVAVSWENGLPVVTCYRTPCTFFLDGRAPTCDSPLRRPALRPDGTCLVVAG